MKKLCVEPGVKSWFVIVDIVTVNDNGNLFDVAGLATLIALKNARFPVVDKETGAINYKEKTEEKLPLKKEPISVTVYKINGKLFLDPTNEEENSCDARLTVASDEKNTISALQKGGTHPLTLDDISQMMDLALDKAKFLRELVNKSLK